MDILETICSKKREAIAVLKKHVSEQTLQERIATVSPKRPFKEQLIKATRNNNVGLIAEIKKASPSRGIIRQDFDVIRHARDYERAGASCLSVLTDQEYFQGDIAYLSAVRSAVNLPILRKDFMVDPYQILEAKAYGADCILLIMAALSANDAKSLACYANALGLDILLEVHNEAELEQALMLNTPLIGINNRDLKSLAVDLSITEKLLPLVPKGRIVISESGIQTHADIQKMQAMGIDCFLVGESLMRKQDLYQATINLLGR